MGGARPWAGETNEWAGPDERARAVPLSFASLGVTVSVRPAPEISPAAALRAGEPPRACSVAAPARPKRLGPERRGSGAHSPLPAALPQPGEECATSCSPLASAAPRSEELGARGDKGLQLGRMR